MSTNRVLLSLFIGSITLWSYHLLTMWAFFLELGIYFILPGSDFYNIFSFSFSAVIMVISMITGAVLESIKNKYNEKIYLLLTIVTYIAFSLLIYFLLVIEINAVFIILSGIVLSTLDYMTEKSVNKHSVKINKIRVMLLLPSFIYLVGFVITLFL